MIFIITLLYLVSFIKVLYLNYFDRLSASIKKNKFLALQTMAKSLLTKFEDQKVIQMPNLLL